jgi:hypothetical protein
VRRCCHDVVFVFAQSGIPEARVPSIYQNIDIIDRYGARFILSPMIRVQKK